MRRLVFQAEPAELAVGDSCGPQISLSAIDSYSDKKRAIFLVGDQKVFKKIPLYKKIKKRIIFIDSETKGIENLKKGYPCKLSGWASLNYLKKSLQILKQEKIKRLVTAPVSKEALALSLPGFCGHTEYLAGYFKVSRFAMMMASERIKTILLTRHLPLEEAIKSLDKNRILDTLSLVYSCLKNQFKIKRPKIVFSSVNPHAGVDTFLAREEKIIVKALKSFKQQAYGPYPADTVFTPANIKKYDCIICPYHDQGMIPFKILAFKDGVNVTLGLPIIRTSPAHGTAFDLIKKNKKPLSDSMLAAIKMACKLKV